MKIDLIWIGKTKEDYLKKGIHEYDKRLTRYISFQIVELSGTKKKVSVEEQKKLEGQQLLIALKSYQQVFLLDDKGKSMDSVQFANQLETFTHRGIKSCAFVIGGAYGFSSEIYRRYPQKFSLSKLTFSHQMIRLLFIEQLYRAQTIIKKEPYHHI